MRLLSLRYNLFMTKTSKLRITYLLLTLLLIGIEVLIALFVHDSIIRPFIGDLLVVIVLDFFVRIFIPQDLKLLPLFVFIFAVFVEILQYFDIVGILGLSSNRFMRILIGGTFDWHDILCYALGCILVFFLEKKPQKLF